MRITITQVAGVADGAGHRYTLGTTTDVDDALGAAWVAAGHAVEAKQPGGQTTADAERPEAPKPKKGKRTADNPPPSTRDE